MPRQLIEEYDHFDEDSFVENLREERRIQEAGKVLKQLKKYKPEIAATALVGGVGGAVISKKNRDSGKPWHGREEGDFIEDDQGNVYVKVNPNG